MPGHSRRSFLQGATLAALSTILADAAPDAVHAQPSSDEALRLLLAGNARYRAGKTTYREFNVRREEVAEAQRPFAMILACADSRVPPELVFDRTLGDLFVVRVAGNYPATGGIGSFEYAYAHFATPLLMVLGHSGCGAVHAAVDTLKKPDGKAPGDIAKIVSAIAPSVKEVIGKPGDIYENAIRRNAINGAANLRSQPPILSRAVAESKLRIVSAVYSLESGAVTML